VPHDWVIGARWVETG